MALPMAPDAPPRSREKAYLIVAGSRTFDDLNKLCAALDFYTQDLEVVEVVSGCARGADTLGEQWAYLRGVPVKKFPADWDRHGRRAGFVRNAEMAGYGSHLVLFWDGKSRGSQHMLNLARRYGLKIRVVHF